MDERFKQSLDRRNRRSFDRFAQETVAACAAWVRIVVHFGSDELRATHRTLSPIPVIPFYAEIQGMRETQKLQPEIESPCNPLKHRVLWHKYRIYRHLQGMAVIESLPLRQSFNFCYFAAPDYQLTNKLKVFLPSRMSDPVRNAPPKKNDPTPS